MPSQSGSARGDLTLSVVVTIVDGGASLDACLTALGNQVSPPTMEILVPHDDSVRDAEGLQRRHPNVRFLPLGPVATAAAVDSHAGQHELFDRRRAAGLAAARGELVAILEDRGVPQPDWAGQAVAAHDQNRTSVYGGAVVNGADELLSWAVYFADFGRYAPPLRDGPMRYATDINVCYKREALEVTRHLWEQRYHETTVHWHLLRSGHEFCSAPKMIVEQRRHDLRFVPLLSERFHWGRLFAFTRAREMPIRRRLVYALLSPALPLVLFLRQVRAQWTRRRSVGKFARAAPALVVLLVWWSVGELVGYVTGKP